MKFAKSIILFFLFWSFSWIFGATCTLDTVPSPAVENYKKNITLLSEALKKRANDVTCTRVEGSEKYLDIAIPTERIYSLLGVLRSRGYAIESLVNELTYYNDTTGIKMKSVQRHQDTLLDLLADIQKTAIYVGSRCANGTTMTENVELTASSYKAMNRTLQDVLADMYEQTTEVLFFYRNLVSSVADEKYVDETYFNLAPAGFAADMRSFYTTKALQDCRDADPKNESIKNMLKKSFSVSWKYPEAIKIWKDAWNLLLYRGRQIRGSAEVDANKNQEIKRIVQAQKGGIGNSRAVINAQFLKEFFTGAKTQSIAETISTASKRIAREVWGDLFQSNTKKSVEKEAGTQTRTELLKYATYEDRAKNLYQIDRNLYNDYARRKIQIGQNKAQDPITVTGLVQSLNSLEGMDANVRKNMQIACKNLSKQATNIDHPDCRDFAGQ